MLENQTYHMKKGDFLLIDCNVMHKYHFIEKSMILPGGLSSG